MLVDKLTPHQKLAYDKIYDWFFKGGHKSKPVFTLFGCAGCNFINKSDFVVDIGRQIP